MKLYVLLVLASLLAACVGTVGWDAHPVSVFDCQRWAAGRSVSKDIGALCSQRELARRGVL